MRFADLLQRFADAVAADDRQGLAALFTQDGVYEDGFFGVHAGRDAIAAMLRRFHETGTNYLWEFVDPIDAGAVGYARFRFSYRSRLPESAGRPIFFEGFSAFLLRDGLIAHYREAFDRGVALVQLGFPAERIRRILERALTAQNRSPEAQRHLARFAAGQALAGKRGGAQR
ncbi:MAG TPA: nuclear transport factor 2 family protein [Stellaceae bacterium]|nr:nuclear transport factor 2 family protein [Stellaceae bacterium]